MPSLQALEFGGCAEYKLELIQIPDGPPLDEVTIESGGQGDLPGSTAEPSIVMLSPIDGPITIEWPNEVVEILQAPRVCRLRGENVAVGVPA